MLINFKKGLTGFSLVAVAVIFPLIAVSQTSTVKNRQLILRDEGLSKLSFVDLGNPKKNWFADVPPGRDLQLVGHGAVMIGTGTGYQELEIKTGKLIKDVNTFEGTASAHRLRNGNTILAMLKQPGKKGIVLNEINEAGASRRIINFPQFDYVRLVRETATGTLLLTSDTVVIESDTLGNILSYLKVKGGKKVHAWQAVRVANGATLVSSGFSADFQLFDSNGILIKRITGPEDVHSYFYSGFQILKNGNYFVTNWQGHGPDWGKSGTQLLEYSPDGKLVWAWKQDGTKYSSIQGGIVLDGLDLNKLHVEDANGVLAPVKK